MIYGWSLKRKKRTKQKLLTHLISEVKSSITKLILIRGTPIEHKMTFQVAKHTNFDSFLSKLQKSLSKMVKKLLVAGIDVEACKQ